MSVAQACQVATATRGWCSGAETRQGEIVKVLAEDSTEVAFGKPLFSVKPAE